MKYGRGLILIFVLLLISQQSYSIPSDEIDIDEGEENTIEFEKQIELNITHPEYRFSISYFNVEGDFELAISNIGTTDNSIQVQSNFNASYYNYTTNGNITEISNDYSGNTFNFGKNSQFLMNYTGKFGCSDCIFLQSWLFNLIEGNFTIIQIEFRGNNLSRNETYPNEVSLFFPFVILILLPIIRSRQFRR